MQNFPSEILTGIKKHFEGEKKRLSDRIAELAKQDPFSDPERITDNAASDAEASEESNHDRVAAIRNELSQRLEDINSALRRISEKTYGYCINCGQMIDTDRLSVLPHAGLCLTCEGKREARTRR